MSGAQSGREPVFAPAPQVKFAQEHGEMITIPRHEFRGLKEQVARMSNPMASALAWSFTFLGVALTAGLALIALYGTKNKQGDVTVERWVLDANWIVFLTTAFLTGFCFWVSRKTKDIEATAKDHCVAKFEEIDGRFS